MMPWIGLADWALPAPDSVASGWLFLLSALATLVLSTAVTMILHISLMWTISGEGFNRMMPGVVPLFAGLIIPLPLFPDWLQDFLYWQPFRGLADVPFRIYSGHIPADEALLEIGMQLGWSMLLIAFGVGLLDRARRNLVVQGG